MNYINDTSCSVVSLSYLFILGFVIRLLLGFFVSYLSDRMQFVKVNGSTQGISQGSVLGLILYSLYTSPLGGIAERHNLNFHFYADDSQFYISFKTYCANNMELSKTRMEACLRDIARLHCHAIQK